MLACAVQPKQGQQQWGTLVAAVRLGERASIGAGTWTSAHGGAVESVLDEATAELAKMEWATMVSTIEVARPHLLRPSLWPPCCTPRLTLVVSVARHNTSMFYRQQ